MIWLLTAYCIVWAGVVLYAARLAVQQRRLQDAVEAIEQQLRPSTTRQSASKAA